MSMFSPEQAQKLMQGGIQRNAQSPFMQKQPMGPPPRQGPPPQMGPPQGPIQPQPPRQGPPTGPGPGLPPAGPRVPWGPQPGAGGQMPSAPIGVTPLPQVIPGDGRDWLRDNLPGFGGGEAFPPIKWQPEANQQPGQYFKGLPGGKMGGPPGTYEDYVDNVKNRVSYPEDPRAVMPREEYQQLIDFFNNGPQGGQMQDNFDQLPGPGGMDWKSALAQKGGGLQGGLLSGGGLQSARNTQQQAIQQALGGLSQNMAQQRKGGGSLQDVLARMRQKNRGSNLGGSIGGALSGLLGR